MTNILDYIRWRGDLLFSQDPPSAVDMLVFSTIIYAKFENVIPVNQKEPVILTEIADTFFARENYEQLVRGKNDIELLRQAACSRRYGQTSLDMLTAEFIPEQDTQFAAAVFHLDDGSAVIAFRGTDNTLVGWKEDFNMSFQQTVPAQRLALKYVNRVFAEYTVPLWLCGHSKGGNLAVFSAARSSPMVQKWIRGVYNFDGPGFSEYMMGDPGYLAMVPRVTTIIPQSSVIGMIMNREEPTEVVKSTQIGLMQHDTFSWEVVGKEFVSMENVTSDAEFVDKTIKNWLGNMNTEERNRMVETIFALFESGEVEKAADVFSVHNLYRYWKKLGSDRNTRKIVLDDFHKLLHAAKTVKGENKEKMLSLTEEIEEGNDEQ